MRIDDNFFVFLGPIMKATKAAHFFRNRILSVLLVLFLAGACQAQSGAFRGRLLIINNGTNAITICDPTVMPGDYKLTLPPSLPSLSGQFLTSDTGGIMSWTDPASCVGAVKFAIKPSDQSITNSATLTNDNDLSFTIGANETWEIVSQLDVASGANEDDDNSPKFNVAITIPSGTLHVYARGIGGDNDNGDWLTTSGTATGDAFEISDEDADGPVELRGIIAGGLTGGTVHIQWAPDASSATSVTVKKNSYLKATKAK